MPYSIYYIKEHVEDARIDGCRTTPDMQSLLESVDDRENIWHPGGALEGNISEGKFLKDASRDFVPDHFWTGTVRRELATFVSRSDYIELSLIRSPHAVPRYRHPQ